MADGDKVGVRFPFINLKKALARADELYKADPRGREMSISAAFAVWDYSGKSSGGFQTIAALRMYGLTERTDPGKIALSEDAFKYFRDEREEVKARLLAQFALRPPVIASLWKDWNVAPPADAVARSHLKNDRGLGEQASRSLLAIYKENIAFASIKGDAMILPKSGEDEEEDRLPPLPEVKVGDYVQWTSGGVDQFKPPRKVAWLSDDGAHLRVHGSMTGIPLAEVSLADPPVTPAPRAPASTTAQEGRAPDINVLLTGAGRLEINATVDAAGLKTLKEMLGKYEQILDLLGRPAGEAKKPDWADKEFKPDDLVPESGIYRVHHRHGSHLSQKRVEFSEGEHFPDCEDCDAGATRYRLED